MKLEDQCCSFELAMRLKELGVKQESYFLWGNETLIPRCSIHGLDNHELFEPKLYAAFTVAELGDLLKSSRRFPYLYYTDNGFKWKIDDAEVHNFDYEKYGKAIDWYFSNTEADARAKMLIYLIENKIIKVYEC